MLDEQHSACFWFSLRAALGDACGERDGLAGHVTGVPGSLGFRHSCLELMPWQDHQRPGTLAAWIYGVRVLPTNYRLSCCTWSVTVTCLLTVAATGRRPVMHGQPPQYGRRPYERGLTTFWREAGLKQDGDWMVFRQGL